METTAILQPRETDCECRYNGKLDVVQCWCERVYWLAILVCDLGIDFIYILIVS
jgi:hypothetical protein